MDATVVVETLQDLADLLEGQVVGTTAVPALIGRVDGPALLVYAQQRAEVTARSGHLLSRLNEHLAALARTKAILQPTVTALADAEPALAPTLLSGLKRLHQSAQSLGRLDARCKASASRALGLVRAYASLLRPVARAYDGRGDAARFEPALMYSERA